MTTTMIHPFDTARARLSDPLPSHIAADISQRTKKHVADAVLLIVMQEGELSGQEINDLYELRAARSGWPPVHIDSPRKRAGELAADGLLTITNPDDPRGTPAIYTISKEQDA